MAGHFRSLQPAAKSFPDLPLFSGFMKPSRFEGIVDNLEIIGEIPAEIDGTFYRVMPDPHFPPFVKDDPVHGPPKLSYRLGESEVADFSVQWFNGDGNISAFRIKDGNVDFKQRYVRTEKFVKEAQARRSLLGRWESLLMIAVTLLTAHPIDSQAGTKTNTQTRWNLPSARQQTPTSFSSAACSSRARKTPRHMPWTLTPLRRSASGTLTGSSRA
jgi:carotenoid cleavage dioxygenase-like enzyme